MTGVKVAVVWSSLLSTVYGFSGGQEPLNATSSGFSCKDGKGNDVDFFYLIKAPGSAAFYMEDGDSLEATADMDSESNAVVQTLAQLYEKMPGSYAYTLYNDEDDTGKKVENRGHTKGVVLFDGDQGFWPASNALNDFREI